MLQGYRRNSEQFCTLWEHNSKHLRGSLATDLHRYEATNRISSQLVEWNQDFGDQDGVFAVVHIHGQENQQ